MPDRESMGYLIQVSTDPQLRLESAAYAWVVDHLLGGGSNPEAIANRKQMLRGGWREGATGPKGKLPP